MKAKYGILAACVFLYCFTAELKAQQPTFTKVFYDPYGSAQGYSVIKTFDQNYLIAGEKDNKALVLKVNTAGNIVWDTKIGSADYTRFTCISNTNDSCFMLCGSTPGSILGGFNIFVVKITSAGDTLWTRILDMGNSAIPFDIQQTSDDGFVIAGSLSLATAPYSKIVVVKLNNSGNIVWCNFLSAGNETTYASSIRQTSDGGFILTGEMDTFSPFKSSGYLLKLTGSGTISWVKKLTLSTSNYMAGFDVVETPTGFLCQISTADKGIVLLKTNFSGDFMWGRNYQEYFGTMFNDLPAPKLNPSSDGGFIFATTSWGGGPMIKIDSIGNIQWAQSLVILSVDVVESDDHGFLLLGNGPVPGVKMAPTDHPQIGIIKTDSLGNGLDCVMPMIVASDTITVYITPVTSTIVSGGALATSHPVVTNAGLSTFEGCVAVTGGAGEKESDDNLFKVNPNPSDGHFQITADQPGSQAVTSLKIFDVMGNTVYESSTPMINKTQINLNSRPNGVYFIQAQVRNKKYSQKLLICH